MKASLIPMLRCPLSGTSLRLDSGSEGPDGEILEGCLVSEGGIHRHPIRSGIPRFVPESNYADNFGMQWNHFAKTQLDSNSGHSISADRFWKATGWSAEDMKGRWVLDIGCGSGRFAEIALNTGAQVLALDYSSAVDACHANLRQHPNFHVVQGDIYALPLAPGAFDFVYSLGVLQHTPDVKRAFAALPPMVAKGGRLVVDYYEKTWRSALLPKYWLRPMTRHLPKQRLFSMVQSAVPVLLPISNALGRVPVLGKQLRRVIPVANHAGILPLNKVQLHEWAVLDTFDWLSPAFDHPQTQATAAKWLHENGLQDVEVLRAGHLVGRAHK